MAIQDFTAGQILTAAQMDSLQANDYNWTVSTKTASYVLVAADKGTRVVMNSASATTITVNTSLFAAGDTLYLQNINTGVCTVTAGTATVTSAGPLAIPQWGSGTLYFTSASAAIYFPSAVTATASGLNLISSTTIGTTVSSVTVSNAFSATYENYLILIAGGVASTDNTFNLTLGSTATAYYRFQFFGQYSANTVSGLGTQNQTNFAEVAYGSSSGINGIIELISPFETKRTGIFTKTAAYSNARYFSLASGYLDNATSYTAFTLTTNAGNVTGGTIRVYGYANS